MLKQMINDYCEVTGRPPFTITVDEYLQFAKASGGSVYISPAEVPSNPEPKVAYREEVREQVKVSEPSRPKEAEVRETSVKESKPRETRPVKNSTESKLDLLKSIVG